MQFTVTYVVAVDVEDEYLEDIYSEACNLMSQGIGYFDCEEG